jgi:ferritin-like protein
MSSEQLHESPDSLRPATVDRHRAVASLMEELEAIDWYDQRIDATADPELASILRHNRDEEKEHASMVLEWLRRHDPALDTFLRKYLFTTGPIEDLEEGEGTSPGPAAGAPGSASLPIGPLRGKEEL